MPAAWIRYAVVACTALTAACAGTSRVGDELTSGSIGQTKTAVALIKLGAADPRGTVLKADIGVREGREYRVVQTARIVHQAGETGVAELELGSGEDHLVSYSCTRQGGAAQLAEPAGNGRFRKSYASFTLAPGEIVNVGYLQLMPLGKTRLADMPVLAVELAVTDWPLAELERF